MTTIISRTVVRVVVPIISITAVALLFQGHNYPGGGFIAGVLTTTAFALIYIVYGIEYLEDNIFQLDDRGVLEPFSHKIVESYRKLFSVGLLVSVSAGIIPILFDYNFLYQAHTELNSIPLFEFEIASAFVFDIGVYLTVVGALLTILSIVGSG